jgi:hypothetical protein
MPASSIAVRRSIRPPRLAQLPRKARSSGLIISTVLHAAATAALIWLPALFPTPLVVSMGDPGKSAASVEYEPLIMPELPQLTESASGSLRAAAGPVGTGSGPARRAANPPSLKPDYAGPQEIVSDFPKAVNRVQTIRRPDLVAPPEMKFPLRLPSMIILPSPSAPVLAAPLQSPKPIATPAQEVPIAQATVQAPVLIRTPKTVAVAPSEVAPPLTSIAPQSNPANLTTLVEPHLNAPKAVVVVNAVNVPPDAAAVIPDAQLTGNFIVGPSSNPAAAEKSSGANNGPSVEGGPSNGGKPSPRPGLTSGTGASSGGGHIPGAGTGNRAGMGTATEPGSGSRNGSAAGAHGGPGAGGAAPGRTPGPASGNVSGRGAGNGGVPGISISGGVPNRNGAAGIKDLPLRRSYGITVIAGGSSGGASRDVGVFGRNETVYSVAIPMADTGGGPDWPMQYALLNSAQDGTGLLSPPFVQKKVAAAMRKMQLSGDSAPVFIAGIIDEHGKLQSLRPVRAQDARSQAAMDALQQWEFLPAQLDGKPVASKVLIGVTVIAAD